MHYYKQIDETGNLVALLTCDIALLSSDFQIEITEEEYNTLLKAMQENAKEESEGAF